MKILKYAALPVIVVVIVIILMTGGIRGTLKGKSSEALKGYYSSQRAAHLNERGADLYIDDNLIAKTEYDVLYFSDEMKPYVPVDRLTRLFGCEVGMTGRDQLILVHKGMRISTRIGGDTYVNGDALYSGKETLIMKDGRMLFDLRAFSELLGYDYTISVTERKLVITDKNDGPVYVPEKLPEAYSMLTEGRLTPVRSQGNLGTCWAFASISALESYFMPDEENAFSPDHLLYNHGFNTGARDGGDGKMALAYFAAWKGPVYEKDDPYGDMQTDKSLKAVKHVQEALMIPDDSIDTIKRMILKHGGVASAFYSDIETDSESSAYYNAETGGYYYKGDEPANHAVVIVGWDDNYPKENFNDKPQEDGAFLCMNSWGDTFGDSGFFYISYQDSRILSGGIVYTRADGPDNYDNIYQADLLGCIGSLGYKSEEVYFANVYTAGSDESLRAAAFYTLERSSEYEIYLVPEPSGEGEQGADLSEAIFLKSGTIALPGYHTVDFWYEEELTAGTDFAILVRLKTEGAYLPAAVEYDGSTISQTADLTDGRGWISRDGKTFEDTESVYGCNLCLKAFTDEK